MRNLLCLAFALLIAAPASASTLDYADEAYRWQGTPERDVLVVSGDSESVTFTDVEGSLTAGELPAGCASVAANSVRCTQLPVNPTLVRGAAGDDTLVGSTRAELLNGGEGEDTLRPGLGADVVEGGYGVDELDLSRDDRAEGVSVSLRAGPDFGDTLTEVEALTLTEHDDFVNVSGDLGTRVQCGAGADLYRARLLGFQGPTSTTEPDELLNCESASSGSGKPRAGNVDLFTQAEKLFKVRQRRIVAKGVSVCSFIGAACRLRVVLRVERGYMDRPLKRPYDLGASTFRVPAGAGHQVAVKLTRREFERLKEMPGRFLTMKVKLSKPGSWVTGAPFGSVPRRYEGQLARRFQADSGR